MRLSLFLILICTLSSSEAMISSSDILKGLNLPNLSDKINVDNLLKNIVEMIKQTINPV